MKHIVWDSQNCISVHNEKPTIADDALAIRLFLDVDGYAFWRIYADSNSMQPMERQMPAIHYPLLLLREGLFTSVLRQQPGEAIRFFNVFISMCPQYAVRSLFDCAFGILVCNSKAYEYPAFWHCVWLYEAIQQMYLLTDADLQVLSSLVFTLAKDETIAYNNIPLIEHRHEGERRYTFRVNASLLAHLDSEQLPDFEALGGGAFSRAWSFRSLDLPATNASINCIAAPKRFQPPASFAHYARYHARFTQRPKRPEYPDEEKTPEEIKEIQTRARAMAAEGWKEIVHLYYVGKRKPNETEREKEEDYMELYAHYVPDERPKYLRLREPKRASSNGTSGAGAGKRAASQRSVHEFFAST